MADRPGKQAVLLIHGVGEQRPMDTLRGFVRAVWTSDKSVQHDYATSGVFSKPDEVSDSFELRRLTTSKNKKGVRSDFYELYWAHLIKGTTIHQVTAWAKRVLWRPPWKLPRPLPGAWALVVGLFLAILFFALQVILPEPYRVLPFSRWVNGVVFGLFSWGIALPVYKGVIGDAARYLDAAPSNIHQRQMIRAKGVALLQKLNAREEYDRIILVGHSLGSVIGYDILTFAWSLYHQNMDGTKAHPVLDEMENGLQNSRKAALAYEKKLQDVKQDRKKKRISRADYRAKKHKLDEAFEKLRAADAVAYRGLQRALFRELQANGIRWKVSDFITLGSPLTHAAILLAVDLGDLESKQRERELPTCPPQLESGRFSFPSGKRKRTPHHAAVFGPTRWTNLYFPSRWVLFGDMIGGPLKNVFGWGILDRPVKTGRRCGFFSHTLYWEPGKGIEASHITTLREALNLLDE